MIPIHRLPLCMLFAVAVATGAGQVVADDDRPPVKLTLHPASEPRPALQYQLLPKFLERIPGNAAVYYGKVTAEQRPFFSNQEKLDKIEQWRKAPMEELRHDDVQLRLGTIEYFLDQATRCEYCDWQLPIRETLFYTILLPELQQTRQFGRIIGTKARIHVARGEFEEAIRALRIGYALGQDAAEGETLVNALVGMAICNIMSDQVLEFVQQPDAPNLYWALTKLPRPLIDIREATEAEMHAIELSFPEVRDWENATGTAAQWSERLHTFYHKLAEMSGDSKMKANAQRAMVTASSIRGYPMAKRALIERGLSPEIAEAMPVGQIILLYTMQTYRDLRDDLFKWFSVPYPEFRERTDAAMTELRRSVIERREIVPVAGVFLPAVQASRTAVVRNDRQIAVLRVIEAIRMYAADHDGQLPRALSNVTKVPVPGDPLTGKPFDYRVDGEVAYLKGQSLHGIPLNYEIRIVRD